jgi:hypothetical protein
MSQIRIGADVGGAFTDVVVIDEVKQSLAEVIAEYELNPIRDLRPVCPNCHAMTHRRKPAYTIEELKGLLARQKGK